MKRFVVVLFLVAGLFCSGGMAQDKDEGAGEQKPAEKPFLTKMEVTKGPSATEEAMPRPASRKLLSRLRLDLGGLVGFFGGAAGAVAEVRFPLPFVFGPAASSLRLAGGLVQSEDMARRFVPLKLDGVLNFPAGRITGVENYLGAGFNYVALTTGRRSGDVGGELFYGVEGKGFGGNLFGELGYAVMRTGFSPSQKGITVLVGYRRQWGI